MREVAKLFLVLLLSSRLCFLAPVCWFSGKLPYLPPSLTPCSTCWRPDPPSFSCGMAAWLWNAAQGRAVQRDCPFWWLPDLDKMKHSSLCLSLRLSYNLLLCLSLCQGRAFSNQVGPQMRRGSLPDVYQKRLWSGYSCHYSSTPRKAPQATQENSSQAQFPDGWQAFFMHFLLFSVSLWASVFGSPAWDTFWYASHPIL